MTRWAAVLAGGSGTRFWPLSTARRPKQLLPLADPEPMIRATVRRLAGLIDARHMLILTSASAAPAIAELLPEIPPANIIAEPTARGTAPPLAWAARHIADASGDASTMVSVHADWKIGDDAAFLGTLDRALRAAESHQALVTVGIVPTRPDPGFGYVQPGPAVPDRAGEPTGARRVARFVEKPDRATAARLIAEGALWNSGIFAWRVGDMLAELARHTPEVAAPLAAAADIQSFFATTSSTSINVGLFERSDRVLVIDGSFGWDDVGTWGAVLRTRECDAAGNVRMGDGALPVETEGSVIYAAEGTHVVTFGVKDLVVVTTSNGLTLVTTPERSADLKRLLDALPAPLRDLA